MPDEKQIVPGQMPKSSTIVDISEVKPEAKSKAIKPSPDPFKKELLEKVNSKKSGFEYATKQAELNALKSQNDAQKNVPLRSRILEKLSDNKIKIAQKALGNPDSKRTETASKVITAGIQSANFVKDVLKTSKGFVTGLKNKEGWKKNSARGAGVGAAVGSTTGLAAGVAMGALGGPVTAIGAGTIGTAAGVTAGIMVGAPIGAATNQIINASSAAKTNHKKFSKKAQEKRADFAKRHKTMAGLGIDVSKTNKKGKISSAIRKLKPIGRKR